MLVTSSLSAFARHPSISSHEPALQAKKEQRCVGWCEAPELQLTRVCSASDKGTKMHWLVRGTRASALASLLCDRKKEQRCIGWCEGPEHQLSRACSASKKRNKDALAGARHPSFSSHVPALQAKKGTKMHWLGANTHSKHVGLARTLYIYTVCIRYFWQKNHLIYGHIRCIYTVLANPTNMCSCTTVTRRLGATSLQHITPT